MAISFMRCDDRIIHGQVVTRWSMERPCDGIIAVNDKAAMDPLIRQALKAASDNIRMDTITIYEKNGRSTK